MEETRLKEKVLKKDFCTTIQNYTYSVTGKRWNQEDASLAYDAFLESLKALLSRYGKVVFESFGSFEVVYRKGKRVHNNLGLKTKHEVDGNVINIPGYQTLYFSMAENFKNEIKNLDYKFIDSEEDGEG